MSFIRKKSGPDTLEPWSIFLNELCLIQLIYLNPLFLFHVSLPQDSYKEVYAYLFFMRIWNGEYEITLYHVGMLPSTVRTFEAEFFEFPDKMGPRDRG